MARDEFNKYSGLATSDIERIIRHIGEAWTKHKCEKPSSGGKRRKSRRTKKTRRAKKTRKH